MRLRIRDLREDKDKTQQEIADILKCCQSCYSKYELGKTEIPNDILIKLAIYYGTSTDYLLGLTNIPQPYPRAKEHK